jgi:hypothetical protein
MDSYSNKINRIKNTIDEIREDIELMKKVIKISNLLNNNFIAKAKK